MSALPKRAEVVIVGGGVMGASTAYHLALRGCTDVLLLERQPHWGAGATGKCAGGIRYQFSTEINVRLSQLSLPMLGRFEAETGQAIDLRWPGYLFLLTREADLADFRRHRALQSRLGVPTEWLEGEAVRRWLPCLHAPDVLAASWHAGDGLADPNGVVMGYVQAARRLGVTARTEVEVTGIGVDRQGSDRARVTGVQTNRGPVACGTVVNAAGPWSAPLSAMAGVPLPVTPVRRQMLTTTALPELPADFPFVIDFASSLYFHREGEGLLTGQSNPDQAPGFDERVDRDWELEHLENAVARLPMLAEAGVTARWAGLYELTPDAHPILGPVPGLAGYQLITGFSGHGFMHGPAAGMLLAETILDGRASSLDVSALDYARFAEGRLLRERNVV